MPVYQLVPQCITKVHQRYTLCKITVVPVTNCLVDTQIVW